MQKIDKLLESIKPIDYSSFEETQRRLDNLTKPQGSLGRLEEFARLIVAITGKKNPDLSKKVIFTLAGDHGVCEEGVSLFPQEVTPQMVYNFIHGGAGINVLSKHVGAKVIVVDMGVAVDLEPHPNLIIKKIGYGTKNITKHPAMTYRQTINSILAGVEVFEDEMSKSGIDITGTGDMGIGNTTPSSAIVAAITRKSVEKVTGRGTGIDDEGLNRKINIIKKAIEFNHPNSKNGLDVLSKLGGFEIGGLVGIILAAAANRVPVVIDGFISGAAALIAYTMKPETKDYMIAGHTSVEKGHQVILDFIGLSPILNMNLRLGEGTGAALAMNLVDAGVKILTQMATFEQAGVSEADK
ncbi:MAG: nicotinate-nucleotide--dimethylbenzimidazole phosphoribosyltransferase [bacterium]|nr:nicotinate-nucleotide--dimethylbenzimidazole phosphoribosyltransferase [bacterium]